MAVVNTKSTAVTNADATPPTPGNAVSALLSSARLNEHVGTAEAANGDSIGSTYRLARIRSGDRVSRVLLSCDAITSAACDVGLYDTAVNGGAEVDASLFASAQSLATALANSDVTHESGTFGIDAVEKRVWEVLGLSKDPGKLYDVVVTLTAAAGAAGTISAKVHVATGN